MQNNNNNNDEFRNALPLNLRDAFDALDEAGQALFILAFSAGQNNQASQGSSTPSPNLDPEDLLRRERIEQIVRLIEERQEGQFFEVQEMDLHPVDSGFITFENNPVLDLLARGLFLRRRGGTGQLFLQGNQAQVDFNIRSINTAVATGLEPVLTEERMDNLGQQARIRLYVFIGRILQLWSRRVVNIVQWNIENSINFRNKRVTRLRAGFRLTIEALLTRNSAMYLPMMASLGILMLDPTTKDLPVRLDSFDRYLATLRFYLFGQGFEMPEHYNSQDAFIFDCLLLGLVITPLCGPRRLMDRNVGFDIPICRYDELNHEGRRTWVMVIDIMSRIRCYMDNQIIIQTTGAEQGNRTGMFQREVGQHQRATGSFHRVPSPEEE